MGFNLFKTFTLRWWQVGVFKLGMLALGIVIGAYWQSIFAPYAFWLAIVAVVALAYITVIWWRQPRRA
jgi:uncharacterized membrane protein YoaK (UPF0700 family)